MPIRSQLLLAITPPLSLGSGLNIILMLLSPMVAIQPNSLTLIFTMPVTSLALERLTTPHKAGWKAVVKKKRPMLSRHHRKERMDFAISHKEWTLEDWKRVVWSDETKVNCLGSDGRKWAWKRVDEPLSDRLVQGTKKFGGGSVMVWGCMTWDGVGMACKIDGRIDGELYCQILDDERQGTLSYYHKTPANVLFQQDNDPKHTNKKAKPRVTDHGFTDCYDRLPWRRQGPYGL